MFSISRSSSFSVIHVGDIKLTRVLEIQNVTPAYIKGWTYKVSTDVRRMHDCVRTKISWINRKPNFLAHMVLRARELRY